MKLFENGVGRPSNETLRKRRMFYGGVIGCIMVLLFVGVITFSNIGSNEIVGALKNSNGNNTLEVYNVKNNAFDIYWTSKKGIKTFSIYKSSVNCGRGSEIIKKNPATKQEKKGSWRIGAGGSASGKITAGNYYLASAKYKDDKVVNVCVQTKGTNANSLEIKNIGIDSFDIYWKASKGISKFTVYKYIYDYWNGWYYSEVGNHNPKKGQEKSGSWRIGEGGSHSINAGMKYKVTMKTKDGFEISKEFMTKENSLTITKETQSSFVINWKADSEVKTITISEVNKSDYSKKIIAKKEFSKGTKQGSIKVGNKESINAKINTKEIWYRIDVKLISGSLYEHAGTSLTKEQQEAFELWEKALEEAAKTTTTKQKTTTKKTTTAYRSTFVISSVPLPKNCYMMSAPTDAKNWRIQVFYKSASASSYGKNKIISKNHYNDGVQTDMICFKKQKYNKENFRIMLKWTTGANDKLYGKVNNWKPKDFKANNSIGWAYKDYTVTWK